MQVVLDSNVYIFALEPFGKTECEAVLDEIVDHPTRYRVRASRTIIDEVGRNLAPDRLKDFWSFLNALAIHPDEDWQVPFELGEKYTALGLKSGDAFIAAYAEWAGVECLVTENRDFLDKVPLVFAVLRSSAFLRRCKSGQ